MFPILCVLVAGLLPFIAVGIAKWQRGYDNNHPRDWENQLAGRQRRAHAAHLNSFESFPLFATAVLFALWTQVPPSWVSLLAGGHVALRCAYIWAYLEDKATLRSLIWMAALACSVALFVFAAIRAA